MRFLRRVFGFLKRNGFRKFTKIILDKTFRYSLFAVEKPIQYLFGEKYLHWRSQFFWAKANNTYRASKEYYDLQEDHLQEILSLINSQKVNAIDIGCGDGRFTFQIAERYNQVFAFDISENLITQAKISSQSQKVSNVSFKQLDLTKNYPDGNYDLVSCMGVTSAIVSNESFSNLTKNLVDSMSPEGFLITKDSLSPGETWNKLNGLYVAIYRSKTDYEKEFLSRGLKLVRMIPLVEGKRLVNYLYLWQKCEADGELQS